MSDHFFITFLTDLEMDVWRTHPAIGRGIRTRHDGLELEAAPLAAGNNRPALEIFIQRSRVLVVGMGVAPGCIRLPKVNRGVLDRIALGIDHRADDVDLLAFGDPFLVTLAGFFIGITLSAPRWASGPTVAR